MNIIVCIAVCVLDLQDHYLRVFRQLPEIAKGRKRKSLAITVTHFPPFYSKLAGCNQLARGPWLGPKTTKAADCN